MFWKRPDRDLLGTKSGTNLSIKVKIKTTCNQGDVTQGLMVIVPVISYANSRFWTQKKSRYVCFYSMVDKIVSTVTGKRTEPLDSVFFCCSCIITPKNLGREFSHRYCLSHFFFFSWAFSWSCLSLLWFCCLYDWLNTTNSTNDIRATEQQYITIYLWWQQ